MRHRVKCPVCEADIIPCPFAGRIVLECEECEAHVVLIHEGPTFESGTVRVGRLMNGHRPGLADPSSLRSVN